MWLCGGGVKGAVTGAALGAGAEGLQSLVGRAGGLGGLLGGAGGGAGAAGGILGSVGGLGGLAKLGLGAAGVVSGAKQQSEASQLRREAIEGARREFESREPLREAFLSRLGQPVARENLGALFAEVGNPFAVAPAAGGIQPQDLGPQVPAEPPQLGPPVTESRISKRVRRKVGGRDLSPFGGSIRRVTEKFLQRR